MPSPQLWLVDDQETGQSLGDVDKSLGRNVPGEVTEAAPNPSRLELGAGTTSPGNPCPARSEHVSRRWLGGGRKQRLNRAKPRGGAGEESWELQQRALHTGHRVWTLSPQAVGSHGKFSAGEWHGQILVPNLLTHLD